LLRGVFHFKFATFLSVSKRLRGKARAFARVPIGPANGAKAAALRAAAESHRQGTQHALLRQIGDVETRARHDVALTERIDFTTVRGVEPLVNIDVNPQIDVLEAGIAMSVHASVDASLYGQHTIGLVKLQLDANGLRKLKPFKRLDGHLVGDHHKLAAARQQTADIDLMRTIHRSERRSMRPRQSAGPPRTFAILEPAFRLVKRQTGWDRRPL
jgi:hypothetical protein